jgi:dihydrofolate reductase
VRRIINSTYITLDGVIEAPQDWQPLIGARGKEGYEVQSELLLSCDALIMGRHTYEGFAPAWSARSGDPMSDHINSMRKYVVSSTLTDPEWENTTVLSGDPVEAIRHLKDSPGGNIVQYGFGELSIALMGAGLLDELRLWIHPLFYGKAKPSDLIYRGAPTSLFELAGSQSLDNSVVILSYQFAGPASN